MPKLGLKWLEMIYLSYKPKIGHFQLYRGSPAKYLKYISATAALYFKVLSFWNDNSYFFVKSVKIIGIPDEKLLSETYVGCTASYFV